jgi:cell division protease FtsH
LSGPDGFGGRSPISETTASEVDAEVLRIIRESHDEAKRLLETNRGALDKLAEALLSRETLDEREILDVTGLTPPPAPSGRPLVTGAD